MDEKKAIEKEAIEASEPSDEELKLGIYKLKHSVNFEGREVKEIDLSALDDVRGRDIEAAKKVMRQKGFVTDSTGYYLTPEFCYCLAATKGCASLELIMELQSFDFIRLQNRILSFLFQ